MKLVKLHGFEPHIIHTDDELMEPGFRNPDAIFAKMYALEQNIASSDNGAGVGDVNIEMDSSMDTFGQLSNLPDNLVDARPARDETGQRSAAVQEPIKMQELIAAPLLPNGVPVDLEADPQFILHLLSRRLPL